MGTKTEAEKRVVRDQQSGMAGQRNGEPNSRGGGAQRRTRGYDGETLMERVREAGKGREGGNNIDSHRSWPMMGEAREERKGCTH